MFKHYFLTCIIFLINVCVCECMGMFICVHVCESMCIGICVRLYVGVGGAVCLYAP